jgi:hypothetical protein
LKLFGAGDGVRTRDSLLGRQAILKGTAQIQFQIRAKAEHFIRQWVSFNSHMLTFSRNYMKIARNLTIDEL